MQLSKLFKPFSKNVVVLSFVSLLNDVAGETVRRLIPLFLATILGVQTTVIGLIEGVGEATPHIFEPISGYISDKTGKKKYHLILDFRLNDLKFPRLRIF